MRPGDVAAARAAEVLAPLVPRFAGRTALVFASGESLTKLWHPDRPILLPSVAVSDAWRIAPGADICYAGDSAWWRHHQSIEYDGLRVGVPDGSPLPKDVLPLTISGGTGYDPRLGYLRHGHNSGTAATHVAAQLGARRIVLVGFDMRGGHWFGDHPSGVLRRKEAPRYGQWMTHFAMLGEELKPHGIEIVNATPGSAMTCFPIVRLEDLCPALSA